MRCRTPRQSRSCSPSAKEDQYVVVVELPSHAAKVLPFLGPLAAAQPSAGEDLLCAEPEPRVFLEQADDDLLGGKFDFLPELP